MITKNNFIRQLKRGNEKALLYVIEQYGGLVKFIVHKHLHKLPNEKDDCINEVFWEVWQHIDRFDPDKNKFENWIAVIAKYRAIDYLRKHLHELEEQALEDTQLIATSAHDRSLLEQEISEETEKLLSCLSQEDKEILLKRYVEELSVEEIGNEYNMTPSAIYTRTSRAKNRLRRKGKLT